MRKPEAVAVDDATCDWGLLTFACVSGVWSLAAGDQNSARVRGLPFYKWSTSNEVSEGDYGALELLARNVNQACSQHQSCLHAADLMHKAELECKTARDVDRLLCSLEPHRIRG